MTEPPTETENLAILIPDALRADHWPDLSGTTVDTIASGPFTPVCLPSIVSGRSRHEHGREWFKNDPIDYPVVFDLEQAGYDVGFWDSPEDAIRPLIRAPELRALETMEPPFVFVARLLWTHTPYNLQWDVDEANVGVSFETDSSREYPAIEGGGDGQDYIDMMKTGDVDFQADYQESVEKTVERINEWRDVLKDRGLYDDTTVIVQADHGEAWGGRFGIDDCPHYLHTHETCDKVTNIKTTVLDRDIEIEEPLLQRDTLSLWDDSWQGGRDDLDQIDRSDDDPDTHAAEQRLRDLGYL